MTYPHAYIALRDIVGSGLQAGGPVVPGTWVDVVKQGDKGWWDYVTPNGRAAAYYVNDVAGPPTRGLYVIFGELADLEVIASGNDEVFPAREMWRREAEVQARKMRRAWSTWIVDDNSGIAVRRRILDVGALLPVALPSVATPFGPTVITKLYRPALLVTLQGQGMERTLEDEPDRNP